MGTVWREKILNFTFIYPVSDVVLMQYDQMKIASANPRATWNANSYGSPGYKEHSSPQSQ